MQSSHIIHSEPKEEVSGRDSGKREGEEDQHGRKKSIAEAGYSAWADLE